MNNFARAHNSYLEPPEDDPVCEDGCGDTLEQDINGDWCCPNKFCPKKFQGAEKEMAEALVEYMDKAKDIPILKRRYLALDAKHDELKLAYVSLLNEFEQYKANHLLD